MSVSWKRFLTKINAYSRVERRKNSLPAVFVLFYHLPKNVDLRLRFFGNPRIDFLGINTVAWCSMHVPVVNTVVDPFFSVVLLLPTILPLSPAPHVWARPSYNYAPFSCPCKILSPDSVAGRSSLNDTHQLLSVQKQEAHGLVVLLVVLNHLSQLWRQSKVLA